MTDEREPRTTTDAGIPVQSRAIEYWTNVDAELVDPPALAEPDAA